MKRSLFLLPAAVLALAGCSQPFHAGAAATVGSTRIPTSQLRDIIERGLASVPPGGQPVNQVNLQRQTLTELIQGRILSQVADALGVQASPTDVTDAISAVAAQRGQAQFNAAVAAAGVAPADLALYFLPSVLEQKIVGALESQNQTLAAKYRADPGQYEQVHVAHILLPTKTEAVKVLAQVRAHPSEFGALAAKFSTDTGSKNQGGDLGFASRGDYVAPFSQAAFAARPGQIIGPVHTQFGYHIIKVIAFRQPTLAQVQAKFGQQDAEAQVLARYRAAMTSLGVHVNPRFGTWVATGAQGLGDVEAGTDELSVPAGSAPPVGS